MNLLNRLRGLRDDFRSAARSLRRTPGFAATTMVSLALGVALTASTLSVMKPRSGQARSTNGVSHLPSKNHR